MAIQSQTVGQELEQFCKNYRNSEMQPTNGQIDGRMDRLTDTARCRVISTTENKHLVDVL